MVVGCVRPTRPKPAGVDGLQVRAPWLAEPPFPVGHLLTSHLPMSPLLGSPSNLYV